jgi:hypothetical protein
MRSSLPILAIALVSLGLRPDPALAEGDVASPACVPTDLTLMEQLYGSAGNGYAFFGSEVGSFTVTCPVTLSNGSYRLDLSYGNDTDGSAEADYYVKVEWKRRNRNTGAVSTLCTDYSASTATETRWMCSPNYYPIDNVGYFYFASVTLHRSTTQASSIRFNGISFVKQ